MRLVAILQTYNEERFIAGIIEHLVRQGALVYLIDNCSTDQTVAIATRYLGRGLIDIENLPRDGQFSLTAQLKKKEEVANRLEANWFMHVDADEIHLPPRGEGTLTEALVHVEAEGYNAVNFIEFTFMPTRESPDHDHPDFQKTMRWYYPFLPSFPHRLNAWKRPPGGIDLASSGGHQVNFTGLRMYPESFLMKHYIFLSVPQAISKYVERVYDSDEVQRGWHRWRAQLTPELLQTLPSATELRTFCSDAELDPSNPRTVHYLAELVRKAQQQMASSQPVPAARIPDQSGRFSWRELSQRVTRAVISRTAREKK